MRPGRPGLGGRYRSGRGNPVEGGVEREEVTAEVDVAVVAAASEHRRRSGGKILPAGMMCNFPEDGV